MDADKVYTAGTGPYVEIALKKYFLNKDGERFDKASEAGVGYEARAEIGVKLTVPAEFVNTGNDLVDLACKHSFARKAQEHFQAVMRSDEDVQVAADGFTEVYGKLLRGERERAAAGPKVDSTESLAIRILAAMLRKKSDDGTLAAIKVPVPRFDDPPKTEKDKINFNAWAKICREGEHPWFAVAMKKAADQKAFD